MTKFIHSLFTPSGLEVFQGYHFQIFSSGKAKVTFQGEGRHQVPYYAERPKRDKEGYRRQKARSGHLTPDHFDLVDHYLASAEGVMIYRLRLLGNNNATADNAHLLATRFDTCAWLVFDSIVHEWELPAPVLVDLLAGTGPKTGSPSVFHEFVPTYEHDWQTATFDEALYKRGYRGSLQDEPEEYLGAGPLRPSAGSRGGHGSSPMTLHGEGAHGASSSALPQQPLSPASLSLIGSPQDAIREPQSAPSRDHVPYVYPDGSYSEPYDEEPDPEDWGMVNHPVEEIFAPCDMVIIGEDHEEGWDADDGIDLSTGAPTQDLPSRDPLMTIGRSTLHTTASLWDQVQG